MEIINNRPCCLVEFKQLKTGDVFVYEGEIYLKILKIGGGASFNLQKNAVEYIGPNELVEIVDARLIVDQ